MGYCGYGDLDRLFGYQGQRGATGDEKTAQPFALPGDEPHYAPDRPADVRHVDIDVTLDFERAAVRGEVTTRFAVLFERISTITFDAAELAIESITLDGADSKQLTYWSEGEKLHVRLDRAYSYGEEFAVRIRYSAQPRTGLVFVKPTEGNPELPIQAWTQGETEYAHYWFPCHDFPNDRATTALRATVPGTFFVLSNGRLDEVREHADGTKTYAWRMDSPFPAYLVTLVAGEFSEIRDSWHGVPVHYYVRQGREDDGRRMLGKTPAMIEFFSQRFGVDFPYVKYGQIVAEQFLGAMENASATTHTYRLLADPRASLDFTPEPVVAHELVHQWHGDMIAIRDWSHTWLKESFATYFEAAWTQHDRGDDEFRAELWQNLHSYLEADGNGRRPIVYNVYRKNGAELFDQHNYEKGSLVLHMLRNVLGEEAFWRALQHYTRRNREREVITADFERAVEEATGRSMGRFFEQWLYKAGHPEFKVTYAWDDAQKLARVSVVQTQKTDATTPIFVTPVDIAFLVPDDENASADDPDVRFQMVSVRVNVEEAQQTFYLPLARRPFSVRFDQGAWLIKTLDFERPAELLRFQLRHDPDSLGRIEAAEALGKLADPQSLAALEQALHAEQVWAVRGAIAEALGKHKSERALNALIGAVDTIQEPKARRAIVAALGEFRAPEQAALAQRSAATLRGLLERGEPSYYVEAQAATSLGKTRAPGAFEALVAKIETPSWNEIIRGGVFGGLGELGDPRAVDVLAGYVADHTKPIDARAAAAAGLRALAATKRIDAGEARTRAVEGLMSVLGELRAERPEGTLAMNAMRALAAWGDQRAIAALEQAASSSVAQRAVRTAREAIRTLQRGAGAGDEVRTLRQDVDTLREENRSLKERLTHLEAHVERPNGAAKQ